MNYKEYIDKRIENKIESNRSFKVLSLVLLICGLLLIILPFLNLIEMEDAMKYAGHGFGFLTSMIPLYLHGQIAKGKKDIIDLDFLKSNVDKIENKLIEKALESI